jgi:uncharacterized protein (TIGR03437 family)
VLAFAAVFSVVASGLAARLVDRIDQMQGVIVPPHAKIAHYVTAASGLSDISATPVTTVSAASFEAVPVAPESIVAAFGAQLATQTVVASDADPNTPGIQLPSQLGGTTVEVNNRRAGLFFVSPSQVNYVMPAATESGTANVVIRSGDGTTSNGTVQIAQVAPAVFSANSNGRGVPAATLLRVKTNGLQQYEALSQYSATAGRFITKPIDMGPDGERLFLILFLTGIRNSADGNGDGNLNENLRLLIGGSEVTPLFAGRQPDFVGLDQINAEIPRSLIGRGIVNISTTAIGFTTSNLMEIEIAGTGGASPPLVSGFGATSALAGQQLIINGNGFSTVPSENIVRIAGLDAEVMSATATSLTVMVPFGVETGTVSVRTATGEGTSTTILPVRTSISGFVENTARQPMSGVVVKVSGLNITATTNAEGSFVLPDVPSGPQFIEVDGGTVNTNPPYPKITLKITALSNRDNQFARAIALQQSTGASGTVGSGTSATNEGSSGGVDGATTEASQVQPQPISIEIDDFKLEVPGSTRANFPSGATRGTLFLTPVQNARTPIELPFGFFSSSIVQITPFNVKLDPGARLVFPNRDGFPAGAQAVLFRYDPELGNFVRDAARAQVSADGQRIETDQGAIKITTYYFAAVMRNSTTIIGRVVEKDGRTPVKRALARYKGQEAFTDGTGSYVLRFVPVRSGEEIQVDVSAVRPSGRIDRAQSAKVTAVVNGTTKVPDIVMPDTRDNRPPTILALSRLEVEGGKTTDVPFSVTDPDERQTVVVRVEGASFASVIRNNLLAVSPYTLRLAPTVAQTGDYEIVIIATDSAGASSRHEIKVTVKSANRAPVASDQSVVMDEDAMAAITLGASDPDGDKLGYTIVSQPANGSLSGTPPSLTYRPNLNFNGADRFSFKVNDGDRDSNTATVAITVRPVNDAPVLTVPGSQTVNEGQTLSFAISATDPDLGQRHAFTATGMPDGAALTAATATSAQFRWTPSFTQSGTYTIVFKVTDDGTPSLSDMKEVRITVSDVSLFTVPSSTTVREGQPLVLEVTANSSLSAPVTITATDVPPGAAFPDASQNAAQLRWTPGYTQSGRYVVVIKGTLNVVPALSETKFITITVWDTERNFADEPANFTVVGRVDSTQQDNDGEMGANVASGDLNGDAVPDLAIGAPKAGRGNVHIFFGRGSLGGIADLGRQAADVTISGEAAGDLFGNSVAIGDINGDGKPELIAGAPGADSSPNAPDAGAVYAVSGNLKGGIFQIAEIAGLTIRGAARSDRFGASLAVGKIRGVATDDLVVGAPLRDAGVGAGALANAGCVYGFYGDQALAGLKDLSVSPASFAINGVAADGRFGSAIAAGNFNGDRYADLAVGAPAADVSGLKSAGMVFVVPGSESLAGTLGALQAASLIFNGSGENDASGAALVMGDLNSDGRADLVIGAPGGDGPNDSRVGTGEVYAIFGTETFQLRPPSLTIYGGGAINDEFPDAFGSRLAIGDFTGDGIADLVVGAPGADPSGSARIPAGGVYVLFGPRIPAAGSIDMSSNPADLRVYGAKPGDHLGSGGLAVGDINGSATGDLILGIPAALKAGSSIESVGEVRVLFGVKR